MSWHGILTLTRRTGEGIVMQTSDGKIRIKVAPEPGYPDRFKLYVQAPRSVRVLREELATFEKAGE